MASRKRKIKIKIAPDTFAPAEYDIGTPELRTQSPVEVYGSDKKKRAKVLSSPLEYYYAREFIDRDQHSAGKQFYKLWYHGGGRLNFATMNLMRVPGGMDGDYGSIMRQKYKAALEAFSTPLACHMVHQVVCIGETTTDSMKKAIREAIEGATNPKNKSMLEFKRGLDDLVKQFSARKPHRGIHE